MATGKFVAYYRVSTQKQGQSGLGLDAQKQAVLSFLNGGSWELIAEYTEVESGKVNDRPQLQAALKHCRLTGAQLVVAKLDRLSRNAAFLFALQESKVKFTCADMPFADSMTVGVLALVAQKEREMISARTKSALAAAKARGTKLGNPRLEEFRNTDMTRAREEWRKLARGRQEELREIVGHIQQTEGTSLRTIASGLNRRGILTPRDKEWTATGVKRLLEGLSA